jgi:hypothetical protein
MSTKSKIQNVMAHMMTSVVGTHSKSHKRSVKTGEFDDGYSHSNIQKIATKIDKTEECEEGIFNISHFACFLICKLNHSLFL